MIIYRPHGETEDFPQELSPMRAYAVGVHSRSHFANCSAQTQPGSDSLFDPMIAVRIDSMMDWIVKTMQAAEPECFPPASLKRRTGKYVRECFRRVGILSRPQSPYR